MSPEQNRQQIRDYLKRQFNLPAEQIDSMIPGFIDTLSGHMANLDAALKSGDLERLGKAAHTMKGALLTLGLNECAEIAIIIEAKSKAGVENTDFQALLNGLRDMLENYLA